MQEAINIFIASAYLNRFIIDNIKANLARLPFQSGRNFRFLLNHDFHPDPQMKKILINMLLEIPNTEVRVYNGDKFFHPKLYLFENGNNMFIAVGSFNATAGGSLNNIEAGVKLYNREIYLQAKEFFDKYWKSEFTQIAKFDKTAVFINKKFKAGDPVIVKSSGKNGVILITEPELVVQEWQYSVFVEGVTKQIFESDLKHIEFWYANKFDVSSLDYSVNIEEWEKTYILEKVFSLPETTIASFASSRTETYPYQFRPLLKILNSSEHRLLIADEVGLGKTIEAGIILKEFLFRMDMKRILVIVPNSLKTKWQDELRIRFDEYFDIINGRDLVGFLNDYESHSDGAIIKGIISYDQLIGTSVRQKLQKMGDSPLFDMVIIDEAHHIKNDATVRYSVIKKLTRNSNALILLTATPIQLETEDLYNLLTILLPKYSDDSNIFAAKLTLNEKLMRSIKYLSDDDFTNFHLSMDEINSSLAFRKQLENIENALGLIDKCLTLTNDSPKTEINEIKKKLYELNILNKYISRTIRKDVAQSFPDRIVETQEYEYTDEEKTLHDAILNIFKKFYLNDGTKIALVVFERQAASSLVAFARNLNTSKLKKLIEEYKESSDQINENDQTAFIEVSNIDSYIAKLPSITADVRDSKLVKLKEIIIGIFSTAVNDSDKKILIFCSFKSTIAYLKEELKKVYQNIYIESMTGDDDIYKRDDLRKSFLNNSPAILICSEVAGEGLDFQFCHYLINYDMPWNPSKLEQRVGRIDRIGQKAEKITIINLVNKYTIEDHIIAKLFERVKLFNNTIGPLGEVLGHYQREFDKNILKQNRTDKEKELYEKRVLENLESKRIEQAAFESRQVELFGVLDYFYDENQLTKNCFQETEIKFIWNHFLKDTHDYYPLNMTPENNGVVEVKLDEITRGFFADIIEGGLATLIQKKKKDHYRSMINYAFENNRPIIYTFSHKRALEDLSLEFLNITHPFIQGALQHLRSNYNANNAVTLFQGMNAILPTGTFGIFVFRFEIQNVENNNNRSFIEEKVLVCDLSKGTGHWESPDIIYKILEDTRGVILGQQFPEIDGKINDYLETESKKAARSILDKYDKLSQIEIEKKKEVISQQFNSKVSALRKLLQIKHDQYQRNKLEQEIKNIESEKTQRLSDLTIGQSRLIIKCKGTIIFINSEEKS